MLDRGDLQRLLNNLRVDGEEIPPPDAPKSLFDVDGTSATRAATSVDLPPFLSRMEAEFPTWPPELVPTRKHSRFGRTCTRMSAQGLTKTIVWRTSTGQLRQLEVCRCGARRPIHADGPERWSDINAALKDDNWPTIRKATSEHRRTTPDANTLNEET